MKASAFTNFTRAAALITFGTLGGCGNIVGGIEDGLNKGYKGIENAINKPDPHVSFEPHKISAEKLEADVPDCLENELARKHAAWLAAKPTEGHDMSLHMIPGDKDRAFEILEKNGITEAPAVIHWKSNGFSGPQIFVERRADGTNVSRKNRGKISKIHNPLEMDYLTMLWVRMKKLANLSKNK